MGRERTLLDRLSEPADHARGVRGDTTAEDLEGLMESVRQNLGRLLNSRQGISEAQPDYGLPAMTDLTAGAEDYISKLQDAIRATIEKYEPRLRRVRVAIQQEASTQQTLVFRVDAMMVARSGEHRVWYETSVRATGQFEVEG